MKLTIVTLGTRGDVQPFVALGCGLQKAGFSVKIATHANHEAFIRQYGLDFAPLPGDAYQRLQDIADKVVGKSILKFNMHLLEWVESLLDELLIAVEDACEDADVILTTPMGVAAFHIAEKRHVPAIALSYIPVANPTRAFASLLVPKIPLGKFGNLLSHYIERQTFILGFHKMYNRWRVQKLGLSRLPFFKWPHYQANDRVIPYLFGYSPHVIPKPGEWNEHSHVTGYWFLNAPSKWEPPQDLVDFIYDGPPPAYIGFGSMADPDPQATVKLFIDALQITNQRGIILRGNSGIQPHEMPDNIMIVDSVPHDWLFPQMAAVVHHGGSGTTAAGLRAGVPSIVVPFFADQPFWGQRVHQLGVGPAPIPRKKLSEENLAHAIRSVLENPSYRENATAIGDALQSEDGVACALNVIQKYVAIWD